MQALYAGAALEIGSIAIALAREEKKGISVALVDSHGEELFFATTDNAIFLSRKIALRKAYTAALVCCSTVEFARKRKKDDMKVMEVDPRFIPFRGGLAIKGGGGAIIGGIGISGLTAEEDEEIAKKAIDEFKEKKDLEKSISYC